MSWLIANWQPIVVAILAIDAVLIPIFPNVGLLVTIKNALSQIGK